jgi:tetratricopeptide (TPR) repeat protein
LSAKRQLDPTDKRRLAEPDYRQGWNSYVEAPSQSASRLPGAIETAPSGPVHAALTWDDCERAHQDPEKAIVACTQILNKVQGIRQAEPFHNRGIAYAARGDIDKAIADVSEGIRLDPHQAYRFQERGELYFKKGDFAEAISDFNQAKKMDATRAFRFHWRGLAYSGIGNFPAAIADFTEAIRLDPVKRGFRFYDRANALRAAGQYALAIQDYDQVLQLDPTNGWAFVDRGRAYAKNDQIALAKSDFEAALSVAGNANPELRQAVTDEMAALTPPVVPPQAAAPSPVPSRAAAPSRVPPQTDELLAALTEVRKTIAQRLPTP